MTYLNVKVQPHGGVYWDIFTFLNVCTGMRFDLANQIFCKKKVIFLFSSCQMYDAIFIIIIFSRTHGFKKVF